VLMLNGKIKSKGNLHIRVALSIRFIRRLKKLSQKDLAKRIDVPRTLVNRWENGLHPPTPSSICKIAEGLGVSPQLIIAAAEEIDLAQEEEITNRTA
jgi:transcriptional regulator with XRE-family HTH domain